MVKKLSVALAAMLALLISTSFSPALAAGEKCVIGWSHYTGWEPIAYADEYGVVAKWAQKYGVEIKIVHFNDYIESVNAYTSGNLCGVAVTNMDTLAIPSVGGVDTTALIIGDFSNGNDGIVMRGGDSVKSLKGRTLIGVELSVSHYLVARALAMNGMSERDITFVNTAEADIGAVCIASPTCAAVTWNPILMKVRQAPKMRMVFDSSQIPGEIIDLLVVRTAVSDGVKKALTGAWYEVMGIMSGGGKAQKDAIAFMAKKAGGTEQEFVGQLKTTSMFYKPADAREFAESKELKETMEQVRSFAFSHGLYGDGAKSKDLVGIEFPDGTIMGDPKNVKFRFNSSYAELAAAGKL